MPCRYVCPSRKDDRNRFCSPRGSNLEDDGLQRRELLGDTHRGEGQDLLLEVADDLLHGVLTTPVNDQNDAEKGTYTKKEYEAEDD